MASYRGMSRFVGVSQALDELTMAEQQPVIDHPVTSAPTSHVPDLSESRSDGLAVVPDAPAPMLDATEIHSQRSGELVDGALLSEAVASSAVDSAQSNSSLPISEAKPPTSVPTTQGPSASTGKKQKKRNRKSSQQVAQVRCVTSEHECVLLS